MSESYRPDIYERDTDVQERLGAVRELLGRGVTLAAVQSLSATGTGKHPRFAVITQFDPLCVPLRLCGLAV